MCVWRVTEKLLSFFVPLLLQVPISFLYWYMKTRVFLSDVESPCFVRCIIYQYSSLNGTDKSWCQKMQR